MGISQIEPSDRQIAALAMPGDDWEAGRRRARRLLNAVQECWPCPMCAPGGRHHYHPLQLRSWVEDGREACAGCLCLVDEDSTGLAQDQD